MKYTMGKQGVKVGDQLLNDRASPCQVLVRNEHVGCASKDARGNHGRLE